MRLVFECNEPVGVLSRVLDQMRRLGIGLRSLSVCDGAARYEIRLELEKTEPTSHKTLFDRIAQLTDVKELRHECRPDRSTCRETANNG